MAPILLSLASYACLFLLITDLSFQQLADNLVAITLSAQLASGLVLLILFPRLSSAATTPLNDNHDRNQPQLQVSSQLLHAMLARAANISAMLTGFGLVVGGGSSAWAAHHDVDEPTNKNTAAMLLRIDTGLLLTGLAMFVTSGLALMLSFWPDSAAEDYNDDVPPTPSLVARDHSVTQDTPMMEAAANDYQLLCDEENQDETTEQSEDVVEDDACVKRTIQKDDDDDNLLTMPLLPVDPAVSSPTPPPETESTLDNDMSLNRLRGTRRLLQLAEPQVMYLYMGCAVLLLRLPCSLSMPHFVATTLSALAQADFDKAQEQIVYLLVAGTIDALLDFWCVFLFGYANQRIVKDLRVSLFGHLLRQEMGFFDVTSSGELTSRLTSDCSEMGGDLTWFFRFSIESVVRITGITVYMLVRCPLLGACAVSIAPIVAAINRWYGVWLAKNAEQVQSALAEANGVAQQALTNVRTVIAFAAERQEDKRYCDKIQRQFKLNVRQLYMTSVYYMAVSTFLVNTVVQGMLLYVGSRLIYHHRLTSEVLLAFMLYQGQLQQELLNLFQSYSSLIKSSGAGDKVFALLDRKPSPPATSSDAVMAVDDLDHGVGSDETERILSHSNIISSAETSFGVQLKNVSFSYPSRPQLMVLQSIDLVIPKGNTVALVGSSGCGKSSVVNLIQRFYDPSHGTIYIDGNDLRSLDVLAYRRHIGVVTQEPVLFQGSILDNILYGCPHASREDAIHAAVLANADYFIQDFPFGYETEVGERGSSLSGGQKQRIAIARAIVKKPSLLLLDEATSALDSVSERLVQDALDNLLRSTNHYVTTLVIAHRLQTVRNSDCIAVLHEGHVVELGCHDELMEIAQGRYRTMVQRAGPSDMLQDD